MPSLRKRTRSQRIRIRAVIDALVFSSLWPAAVALALMSAAARTLDVAAPPAALALGFFGTLFVYNVDRLRDVERDRATTPARAAFIERHRSALKRLCAAAALASGAAAAGLPWPVLALCGAVLAAGLLHRRLKQWAGVKTAYITLAWVAVCVGIPALVAHLSLRDSLAVGLAFGATIAANLIVSNVRDEEGGTTRVPNAVAIGLALLLCIAAGVACLASAFGLAPELAPIPVLEALSIGGFTTASAQRDRERYGLVVVDGALLVGALTALLLFSATAAGGR